MATSDPAQQNVGNSEPTARAKAGLRKQALARRREMPPDERDTADQMLVRTAVQLASGRDTVAAYLPIKGEPGDSGLVAALSEVVSSLLLPVVQPDLDLDWAVYAGADALAASVRGVPATSVALREPTGARLGVAFIANADLIFVPALAVDAGGYRLGRGGGCYDRALARVPAHIPTVALIYDHDLCDSLPRAPHDIPVTRALTPSGLHDLTPR